MAQPASLSRVGLFRSYPFLMVCSFVFLTDCSTAPKPPPRYRISLINSQSDVSLIDYHRAYHWEHGGSLRNFQSIYSNFYDLIAEAEATSAMKFRCNFNYSHNIDQSPNDQPEPDAEMTTPRRCLLLNDKLIRRHHLEDRLPVFYQPRDPSWGQTVFALPLPTVRPGQFRYLGSNPTTIFAPARHVEDGRALLDLWFEHSKSGEPIECSNYQMPGYCARPGSAGC